MTTHPVGNQTHVSTVQADMGLQRHLARRRPVVRGLTATLLVIGASSCGGATDDPVADPASESAASSTSTVVDTVAPTTTTVATTADPPGSDPTTTMSTSLDSVDASQPPVVGAAVADLSMFLGVPTGGITVARFDSVTWRDGSLGCPQPGRSYTQALVDGYRIELVDDSTSYWYHGADGADPFRCDSPQDPVEGGGGSK